MRSAYDQASAQTLAWAKGGDGETRRALLERVRDGGDPTSLQDAAALGQQLSPATLRQIAGEVLTVLSARRGEQVAQHQRQNLQARSAQKAPTFQGGGSVLNFRLNEAQQLEAKQRAARRPVFEGPDPILRPPSKTDQARAEIHLRTLAPGQKLSSKDAQTLVEQSVFAARRGLYIDAAATKPGLEMTPDLYTAERVAGACGFGQGMTYFAMKDLGIAEDKLQLHQAATVFGGPSAYQHAFLVAQMPDGKAYLIDTTFRQFFNDDQRKQDHIGWPGEVMRQSERGSKIADELIKKGYVELTDTVAREYGRALSSGSGRPVTAQDLLHSTAEVDYARNQLQPLLHRPAPEGSQ